MVFIKHNSLNSDKHFNSIVIPCFLGFKVSRVQVCQGPGFSGSRFLRVRVQVLEVAQKICRSGCESNIFQQTKKPSIIAVYLVDKQNHSRLANENMFDVIFKKLFVEIKSM